MKEISIIFIILCFGLLMCKIGYYAYSYDRNDMEQSKFLYEYSYCLTQIIKFVTLGIILFFIYNSIKDSLILW